MKNRTYLEMQTHPFIVFWLGVLTGALIISMIFFYRMLAPKEYKSAVINPSKTSTQAIKKSRVLPKNTKSFPTPQGGLNNFPTPQGG